MLSNSNPSIRMSRVRHDKSTSNLIRHADTCDPATAVGSSSIEAYSHGSSYHPAKHRMKIALWIARHHRPFSVVQDEELLEIFHDLNSQCVTPSRVTVSRDVKDIFKLSRAKVAALLQVFLSFTKVLLDLNNVRDSALQEYQGKLHLCIDGWTSPQVISFLGVTVHWIREGCIQSVVLDFIKCVVPLFELQEFIHGSRASKAHTGVYLASRLFECLREYGIEDKVCVWCIHHTSDSTNPSSCRYWPL